MRTSILCMCLYLFGLGISDSYGYDDDDMTSVSPTILECSFDASEYQRVQIKRLELPLETSVTYTFSNYEVTFSPHKYHYPNEDEYLYEVEVFNSLNARLNLFVARLNDIFVFRNDDFKITCTK